MRMCVGSVRVKGLQVETRDEGVDALLFFCRDEEQGEKIIKESWRSDCIIVYPGTEYAQCGERRFVINPRDMGDYKRLIEQVIQESLPIKNVVHAWHLDGVEGKEIEDYLGEGLYSLLYLVQALIRAKRYKWLRVLYVYEYNNGRGFADAMHGSVGGFFRTLHYENPKFRCDSVGVRANEKDECVTIIEKELCREKGSAFWEVFYDEGKCYERCMQEVLSETFFKIGQWDKGSLGSKNYLISGGAGGLGLIFSQYLCEHYGARVFLLGRRQENEAIKQQLDSMGKGKGQAYYFSVDIADEQGLKKVVDKVRNDYGAIHGVIHAAGLIEDAYILRKEVSSFQRVVCPKIKGGVNLDVATGDQPLDFFIAFSSIAALMPNQGQCDYAAGNSFLDYFCI